MGRFFCSILVLALLLSGLSGCGMGNMDAALGEDSFEDSIGSSDGIGIGTASAVGAAEGDLAQSDSSEMFTGRDYEVGYDESNSVFIRLDGDFASASSDSVKISGTTVTITEEATYILSGMLDDGMVIVDAADSAKLQLVLDGAKINSGSSAALYILGADKVFVTLAEGTENVLSNGGNFTAIDKNNIDAAVFSKQDLTFNGSGSLTVISPVGHGIVCKDDLVVTSGTYAISSASHGIEANDSMRVANAVIGIVAGKDGIHAENDDDASLGFVYISGGSLDIEAEGDGISAGAYMRIDGGAFDIVSGGGSVNASKKVSDAWGGFKGGGHQGLGPQGVQKSQGLQESQRPQRPQGLQGPQGLQEDQGSQGSQGSQEPQGLQESQGSQEPQGLQESQGLQAPNGLQDTQRPQGPQGFQEPQALQEDPSSSVTSSDANDSSTSIKGLKAAGDIVISDGTFTIDSADDAVHSNGSITVNGGTFEISSGDDGFHADETLAVTAGEINIAESYEGLEALHVAISGGDIRLAARDDGLNAAGGMDSSGTGGMRGGDKFGGRGGGMGGRMGGSSSASGGSIVISGGRVYVEASGDGLDANGTLEISGGYITVCGPAEGDTATLDYDVSGTITGGTFAGSGAAGMAQTFSSSEQGVVAVNIGRQPAGTMVTLEDMGGSTVVSYTPELPFEVIIISSPDVVSGEGYILAVGSASQEVKAG